MWEGEEERREPWDAWGWDGILCLGLLLHFLQAWVAEAEEDGWGDERIWGS